MPDYEALAKQAGAVTSAPPGVDYAALATQAGGTTVPDFKQTDTSPNDLDPNTAGTFAKHLGAQINPLSLVQMVGQAILHPIDTTKAVGKAQGALYEKAADSYAKGDYATAARHFVNYLLPLVGPGLDKSSDLFQAGHWAAGGGDALGLGLAMFGPTALENVAAARYPLAAAHPGAPVPSTAKPEVQFAQQRNVPLDAATVSDNFAVKGAQTLADKSLGGSLVATPARTEQAAAMTRVGGELADAAHPVPMTPETAGTALRDALTAKVAKHTGEANAAYDTLRTLEEQPASRMQMPLAAKPVDALTDGVTGQLRRIVHELDAAPYTKRLLQPTETGGAAIALTTPAALTLNS